MEKAESSTLQNERMFLETKMDILVEAHERLDRALEDNVESKRVESEKFETWEREHSDALKRINYRVVDLRQEKETLRSSRSGRTSQRLKSSGTSMMSGLERKADMAAKVAKLKTELIFADAEARKSAALKEHEEELKKRKLTKKLALAKAEMDAVSKVEESEFGDLQEVLPKTTDKGDLLQKYLSTQVESVTGTSLTTLQTDVEFTPDPTEIVENGKPDNEHESSPEIIRSPPSASQKEPVVTASPYPTLNPFAPEYVAVSTPKFVPTSRLPFPQDQTAGPRKTAPVPKQDGNFTPSDSSSENALQRLADLLFQKRLQD